MRAFQRYKLILYTLFLFLGLAYYAKQAPIWYDEHIFNRFAWDFTYFEVDIFEKILSYSKIAYHPPLYLVFVAAYSKILAVFTEPTLFLLRLSSCLFTAFGFSILIHSCLKRNGSIVAIFILCAFQLHTFYYAYDFGPYPMAFMLSACYLHVLNNFWDQKKFSNKNLLTLSVLSILLSYTHYFGTLTVLSAGIVYIYKSYREKKEALPTMVGAHFCAMIAFLPWFFIIRKRVLSEEAFKGNPSSGEPFLNQIAEYFLSISAGSLFICLLILFIAAQSYRNKRFPFVIFSTLVLINIARSSTATPLLVARYNIPVLPFLFYAFSLGLNSFFPKKVVQYTFLGFLLFFTPNSSDYQKVISMRWFDVPAHFEFIDNYLKENGSSEKITLYIQATSEMDAYPYKKILNDHSISIIAIQGSCTVKEPRQNSFLVSFTAYCKKEGFNTSPWSLLYELHGTKTWRLK